ncbi:hypothetical protein [Streptomyces sp. NPDC004250]|uniref:hypothetical protein n=1 Tax=Streptomyces sp. NPDC004250 TaxID=3364692 RepID=UPI0036A608EA
MMLTRRRRPSAPSPCTGSGEGDPRSSGPVGLAALPRPVAVAAAHPDRAAPWLEHVWAQPRRRDVYQLCFPASRAGVFTDRGLRRLIARAGLPERIEELAAPFTAVAMDLVTGVLAALRAAATASRAGQLLIHRQIERGLVEVSRLLPTVVLPTGTDVWPAPWDFRHSRRLVEAAAATAGHHASASAATRCAPRLTPERAGL